MVNKYPANKNPRKQPNWPDKTQMSRQAFTNKARYIWNAWNANRMKAGLLRVDPPDNIAFTTMRPALYKGQQRPPSKSISFAQWQSKKKDERPPLLKLFDKQNQANIDKFIASLSDKSVAVPL